MRIHLEQIKGTPKKKPEEDDMERRKWPKDGLLPRRMAALDIDVGMVESIEPALLCDLRELCAACKFPAQCDLELRDNPGSRAWLEYCPNSDLLGIVAATHLFSRLSPRASESDWRGLWPR
jgi:hypothetical protein